MDLTSIIDKALEWERPMQTVQLVAITASALASILYLQRWYNLQTILNETTYCDYRFSSPSKLTELQQLASVGKESIVATIATVVRQKEGCVLGAWGSDVFRTEAILQSALEESQSRVFGLDFHNIVWAESLSAWMSRLYKTSNPVRTALKEIISLIRGDDNYDGGQSGDGNCDDISAAQMGHVMVEFRTLLAEKKHRLINLRKEDPSAPLVFYVQGIDRLMLTEKRFGRKGLKVINEFLDFFIALSVVNVHVIISMSDQFWLRFWMSHPALTTRSLSLHVPHPSFEELRVAWTRRVIPSAATATAVSAAAVTLSDNRIIKNTNNNISVDVIDEIIGTYGYSALDINRAVLAVESGLSSSVSSLAKSDLRMMTMSWMQSFSMLLKKKAGNDHDDEENGVADDDELFGADGSTGDSLMVGENGKLRGSSVIHSRLVRLLAQAPRGGALSLHTLMLQPDGHRLLEYAIAYMCDRPDSFLTLHLMDEKEEVHQEQVWLRENIATRKPKMEAHGSNENSSANCKQNMTCKLNSSHLTSFGLYFKPRRPLYHVSLKHIDSLLHTADSNTD